MRRSQANDSRLQSTDDKVREHGNTVATLQNALKDRDFKIDMAHRRRQSGHAKRSLRPHSPPMRLANASNAAGGKARRPSHDAAVEATPARCDDRGAAQNASRARDTEIDRT